jgi:hypothetical protein
MGWNGEGLLRADGVERGGHAGVSGMETCIAGGLWVGTARFNCNMLMTSSGAKSSCITGAWGSVSWGGVLPMALRLIGDVDRPCERCRDGVVRSASDGDEGVGMEWC